VKRNSLTRIWKVHDSPSSPFRTTAGSTSAGVGLGLATGVGLFVVANVNAVVAVVVPKEKPVKGDAPVLALFWTAPNPMEGVVERPNMVVLEEDPKSGLVVVGAVVVVAVVEAPKNPEELPKTTGFVFGFAGEVVVDVDSAIVAKGFLGLVVVVVVSSLVAGSCSVSLSPLVVTGVSVFDSESLLGSSLTPTPPPTQTPVGVIPPDLESLLGRRARRILRFFITSADARGCPPAVTPCAAPLSVPSSLSSAVICRSADRFFFDDGGGAVGGTVGGASGWDAYFRADVPVAGSVVGVLAGGGKGDGDAGSTSLMVVALVFVVGAIVAS